MTDMSEPSPESPGPRPSDAPTGAKPSGPAAPAASRAKGPPQDPEAFQRWIGIERLKVDMRRLELETKRLETPEAPPPHPQPRSAVLPILYGVILVALVGLTAFLAAQVIGLRGEIGALRTAQTEIGQRLATAESEQIGLREAIEAAQTKANAAAAAPLQPSPQASSDVPAAPNAAPAEASSQAVAAPAAPDPALPGSGYTVRIFAPVNAVAKAKIDGFVNPLKAVGYDVVVSDTGVVQTTSNSLSYHASSEEMAKRLSTLIQQKKPALTLEMRASPSIPPSARQILILNLTEDAFN